MKKPMNFALTATLSLSLIGAVLSALPALAIAAVTASQGAAQASGVLLNAADAVPEIVALGLRPQVYKVTTSQLQNLDSEQDKYALQVNIGRVTAAQFAKLHAMYGGQSQVAYDTNKSYNLIDFLPPVIQATVNHTFTVKKYDIAALSDDYYASDESMKGELWELSPLVKNGVTLVTNCWGTSIEVVKHLRDPQLNNYIFSWPSRQNVDFDLKSDKHSKMVRSNQLRFGDMMLVSKKEGADFMLQHTAIILGENLVFEKTDTSENDPYRLSLKSDVLAKYEELFRSKGRVQFRRFSADKEPLPIKSPLKEPFEIAAMEKIRRLAPEVPLDRLNVGCESGLGGGCEVFYTEIKTVQLIIDKNTGRGKLVGETEVMKLLKPLE